MNEKSNSLEETVRFHGHLCPGLVIGYRAAKEAMASLNASRAEDEELIAIVENDSCSVDAIQWLTGCTFGKGNFFFRDYGKQVFTLALRPSGDAIRLAFKNRKAEAYQSARTREEQIQWILDAPIQEVFDIRKMTIALPDEARIHQSVVCDRCGEEVMASRTVKDGDLALCRSCHKAAP